MHLERKHLSIPRIIAVICVVIMSVSFFMPYISADKETAERMVKESKHIEMLDMHSEELINISAIEYIEYLKASPLPVYAEGKYTIFMLLAIAFFCLGSLIFAICNIPVIILVFSALIFPALVINFISCFFGEISFWVFPTYHPGIAFLVIFVCNCVLMSSSILMIVNKLKRA